MAAGLYANTIFPWLNDKLCADPALVKIRADALAAARGKVVEIGFGTGLNLAHYPSSVTELVAVEPSDGMLRKAEGRMAGARFPVRVIHAVAESLPLPDASFDTAVSVLTLCSVTDPSRVLGELRRVLRDDGQLIVVEHGLAGDPGVATWQRRLDWLQGKLACGCHLTRPIVELLRRAGFQVDGVRQFFAEGMPKTHGYLAVGRVTQPAARAPGDRAGP